MVGCGSQVTIIHITPAIQQDYKPEDSANVLASLSGSFWSHFPF